MRSYNWQQIPRLMVTKSGRRRLTTSILHRLKRIIIPLSNFYRKYLIRHVKIVTVIGSFGKTTTTRATAVALGLSLEKFQGKNVGVFLAAGLLSIPPWARFHVMEVGISKKGQMEKNAALIHPDIAVVTCIGSEHGTTLGGLSQTREEKALMVRALPESGLAVLNGDDPHVRKMKSYTKARVVTYGYGPSNDLQANYIKTDLSNGTQFSFNYGNEYYEISTKLFGKASTYSLMSAFIVAREFKISPDLVLKRLSALKPMHHRLEIINTISGVNLLVDTFKSAFETVEHALDTFEALQAKRKIIILGEVEELPDSIGNIYRAIGARVAETATCLIFIGTKRVKGPLFGEVRRAGMKEENLLFAKNSISRAKEMALEIVEPGDLVLIKGRSSQKMERIAIALMGKPVSCNLEFCNQKTRCNDCLNLNREPTDSFNDKVAYGYIKNTKSEKKNKDINANSGWLT